MRESIMQNESDNECYFCFSRQDLQRHHCLHGTANRKKADHDGLTVLLCAPCHRDLHDRGCGDTALKQAAQRKWMQYYGRSEADFRKRYGKSYL